MAVLADRYYIPTAKFTLGANVATFITISVENSQQMEAIDKGRGSPNRRPLAGPLADQLLILPVIALAGREGRYRQFSARTQPLFRS